MDISVIIVSYNVRTLLATCLLSLRDAVVDLDAEVFVVDNASSDGSAAMVAARFPEVTLIASEENLGFARANNLALARARGRHLMLLNPDTVLRDDSLTALVHFLDAHPECGAVGPKLLNSDGSFQATAKRAIPTPWSSFCKLSGLSAVFPRSRLFNEYELGYLDENEPHEVGTLCGAAMLVRREAYDAVGGLDETYFLFGEDIAWSDAIARAGWTVAYDPASRILHVKGQSMARDLAHRDRHFFRAMRIFYRQRYAFGPLRTLLLDGGVALARIAALGRRNAGAIRDVAIDTVLLGVIVWLLAPLLGTRDEAGHRFLAGWLTVAPVALLALLGRYRRSSGSPNQRATVYSLASGVVFAFLAAAGYFLSGLAALTGPFVAMWAGLGWVVLNARRVAAAIRALSRVTARSVLTGDDGLAREWARRNLESTERAHWAQAAWDGEGDGNDRPAGDTLPGMGRARDLPRLAATGRIRRVVYAAGTVRYTAILDALESEPLRGVDDVAIIDESRFWDDPGPDAPVGVNDA